MLGQIGDHSFALLRMRLGPVLSICQNVDESLTWTEVDGDRVRVSGYEAGVRGL